MPGPTSNPFPPRHNPPTNPPANTPDPRDALRLDLSQMSDSTKRDLTIHYMGELIKVYEAQVEQSRASDNPLISALASEFRERADEVLRLQSHVTIVLSRYDNEKAAKAMIDAMPQLPPTIMQLHRNAVEALKALEYKMAGLTPADGSLKYSVVVSCHTLISRLDV